MTTSPIALLVELARAVLHNVPDPNSDSGRLARAVLDLLVVDKPCGWDVSDVVTAPTNTGLWLMDARATRRALGVALTPDEAHWAALVILEAALNAKEQGK